jgi:hypothetical protein
MEAENEERIDVRLNEWAFDQESAGFMLRDDDAIVVYLWQRGVIPRILKGDAPAMVTKGGETYVYQYTVLDAEGIDPASATMFAIHSDSRDGFTYCHGPIPEGEVMEILVRVDPRFRKDESDEWKFE